MPRDDRQMLDFAARGKYPIAIGPSDVLTNEFIARGLPLKHLRPETLKEGTYITAGNGSLAIPRSAPHPNALRVYVDFLFRRKASSSGARPPASPACAGMFRRDHVQDILVPKDGMPYPDISNEKYVRLREEIVEFIKTIMPR